MIGAHNGPFRRNRGIAQAGLDFDFRANLYQKLDTDGTDMARTSTLADLVTVSRASKKTNAGGWDFTNGGTVGTLTEVNNNEPALDGTKGVLIEESSTNEIRNPRCEGAVAGTPGTMPTNWLVVAGGGVTTEVVGSGTEDGWPYLEFRISGTPTASTTSIYFEASTQIAALVGETFTLSSNARVTAGDMTNVTNIALSCVERDGGGVSLGSQAGSSEVPTAVNRRFRETFTMAQASVAYIQPRLDIVQAGGAVDLTMRIYAPQNEEKGHATSPIFPPVGTPGASTRAPQYTYLSADAWYNATALSGCLTVQHVGDSVGMVVYFSDGTLNERMQLRQENTTRVRLGIWAGGVQGGDAQITSATAPVAGDISKYAFAIATNDAALSIGGEIQATDSSLTISSGINRLDLGNEASNALPWNGWVKDFTYFPERLTNAQLETLVGN